MGARFLRCHFYFLYLNFAFKFFFNFFLFIFPFFLLELYSFVPITLYSGVTKYSPHQTFFEWSESHLNFNSINTNKMKTISEVQVFNTFMLNFNSATKYIVIHQIHQIALIRVSPKVISLHFQSHLIFHIMSNCN